MNWIAFAGGVFMMFIALAFKPNPNWVSMLVFRVVPFFLGMAVVLSLLLEWF